MTKPYIVFDITPVAKPRLTQRDKWSKRPVVQKYWDFKDQLNLLAKKYGFELPEAHFHLVFIIPMPKSWSKKKKKEMYGRPHQQKPDVDNMIKSFFDCLSPEDSNIWDVRASKFWGEKGQICVADCEEFKMQIL